MSNPNPAKIGGFQFLDFVQAGPRKSTRTVAEQRKLYLNPQGMGWSYYGPLYAGFKAAVSAPDPRTTLDQVVNRAAVRDVGCGRAFAEASDGFLHLLGTGVTGVPVQSSSWQEGDLTIDLRRMTGLRTRKGDLLYVAPYVKEPELTQDDADVLLYLMDEAVAQALPNATPVVWDTRRGQAFKLRRNTNRKLLGCHVRGQAAAYMVAWHLAA